MTRFVRLDVIIDVKKLQVMGWRLFKYGNPAHVRNDILPSLNKLPKLNLSPVTLLEILQKEDTEKLMQGVHPALQPIKNLDKKELQPT